jgi:hypothetical protein
MNRTKVYDVSPPLAKKNSLNQILPYQSDRILYVGKQGWVGLISTLSQAVEIVLAPHI